MHKGEELTVLLREDGGEAKHPFKWLCGGHFELDIGGLQTNSRLAGANCLNIRSILHFEVQIEEKMVGVPCLAWILRCEVLEGRGFGLIKESLVWRQAIKCSCRRAFAEGGE